MKPHLPKKLTAALLAACTALALNTTAAAADTGTATFTGGTINYNRGDQLLDMYLTKGLTTGTATNNTLTLDKGVNITGGNFFAGNYTVSIWVTKDSLNSDQLLFAYGPSANTATNDTYGANGIYWNAASSTITIGRGKVTGGYTTMAWQDNKTTGSLASALGSGDLVNLTFAVTGGNQSEAATVWVNGVQQESLAAYAGNMNGGNAGTTMQLFVSSAPTYGNISVTNQTLTNQTDIYTLMGLSSEKPAAVFDYVWKGGTDGKWDTTTANWETKADPGTPVTFTSGAENTVTFGADAERTEVTLSTAASVASVTVDGGYKLTIGADGSLTTGTLSIAGVEATIDGAGTLTAQTLSIAANGTLNLATTGTLSIGAMSFGTGSKLNIGAAVDMGTLALTSSDAPSIQVKDGGELAISTASKVDGQGLGNTGEVGSAAFSKIFQGKAVAVEAGGKLVLKGNINAVEQRDPAATLASGVDSLEIQGTLQINTWGPSTYQLGTHSMKVTGDAWFTNRQFVEVAGGSFEVGGALKLGHAQNGTGGNYRASLTATDGSHVTLHDIQFYGGHNEVNVDASELTFTKADGNVLSQAGTATPTAAADLNSVNLTDATLKAVDNSWILSAIDGTTVNVSGATTLEVGESQTLSVTATTINGSFTKNGTGTAAISGGGALTATSTVNAGSLALFGTYEIGGITPTGGSVVYADGEHSGNGYEIATGTITVYTGSVEDHASYTYRGGEVTLTRGAYELPGTKDATTYYINAGTDSYNWIDTNKTAELTGGIVVKSGASLKVDKDIDMSLVAAASAGTVEIDSGKVATSDSTVKDVTLAGAGTYALGNGNVAMTATLGDAWAGTVRIGGFAFDNAHTHSLSAFRNNDSVVEMNGITGGYLEGWNGGTEAANIRLTDPGDDGIAWQWSDGTSNNGTPTIEFTGAWEGSGTFQLSNLREGITYSGDISGWDGTFDYHGNYGTTLTFKDDATEINAAILNNGVNNAGDVQKQFHIIVQNGATFNKDVAAYTLDVADGASATFEGDATFHSLSGSGDVALGESSTLTVADTVGSDVQISAADGATINASLDSSQVSIAATAHFAQGINDASGVKLSAGEGTVDVKNNGAYPTSYTISNGEMDVQADALTLQNTATDAVTVDNALTVNSIVNDSEHALAVSNLVVDNLTAISALSGNIDITSTQGDMVVAALNIADGKQVFIHNGPEETEVTVTVTETLAAGNGTLLANLEMADDSSLLLNGAGDNALVLGSTLDLGTGIKLDTITLQALDAMSLGETLMLVKAADDTDFTYLGEAEWFGQVFSRSASEGGYDLLGDYTVFSEADGFGLTKVSNTPEPATGTLSLLALAALAARRRRK